MLPGVMAGWGVALDSCRGQLDHFLCTQQICGLTGSVGRAPAHLDLEFLPLQNNEVVRCSSSFARNPDRPTAGLDMRMGGEKRTPTWGQPLVPGMLEEGDRSVTAETVGKLCQEGRVAEAVEALQVLVETGYPIPVSLFYAVLKICGLQKDLALGRRVHGLAVELGYESDTILCNHILRMYVSHAKMQEAMDVFTLVSKPDAFTWSAIISGHVKHGQAKQAIQLYHQMRRSSLKPDGHVFVAALQACARGADLQTGKQVHADVLASGAKSDLFVGNSLVYMYAKCGCLEVAQRVFDSLARKDVVTWNAMIAGYSQQGMGREALHLYSAMKQEGTAAPDSVTFVCLLQACASLGAPALEKGRQLHAQIRQQGLQADVVVGSSLVNMYSKCGSLKDAQVVFDGLGEKNVVTWTALIAGYAQQGMGLEALDLYNVMQEEGIAAPDSVTYICLLQACASVGPLALETGKQLRAEIQERGLQVDVNVGNNLMNMFAKCGSLEDAQSIFNGLGQKDVVSWTTLIAGYSQQGMGREALHLYSAMEQEGLVAPDSVTFVCLLQACTSVGSSALDKGKQIHAQIKGRGLQVDVTVGNNLINMYAKCGSLEDAHIVFDEQVHKDVVTWTTLIAGYSQQGMGQEALHLYSAMKEELVAPNSVTFVCVLQACASVAALHAGRQLHDLIGDQVLQVDLTVARSLINMYAKCGSMADAQEVFDALPQRDVIAWNALIAGYSRQGDTEGVFNLVHRMRENDIQPDGITFLSLLTVCSHAGLVDKGHEYFEAMRTDYGITPTVEHYTCMVDLLGRAGQLQEAIAVVKTMPVQPPDVWHALLGACQKWSNVEVGRYAFDEAVKLNVKDASAYVSMSNIYLGAQMWEEAQEVHERRTEMGAWKQPGQSWWTDMDGLVHAFVIGDKKHPEIDGIYARLQQLLLDIKSDKHVLHADMSL